MELTPVTCNHCGASLQVSDSARFVTCRYCNSQLEIKRTDSVISTEVLQHIDQNTTAMAEDLHALRRDSELERLDREWNLRREQFLVRGKDGTTSTPSANLTGAIIAAVFGVFWTIFAFAITSHAPAEMSFVACIFPLFGIVFVIVAIVMGVKSCSAATQYQQEERNYQFRRQQLLSQSPTDPSSPASPRP